MTETSDFHLAPRSVIEIIAMKLPPKLLHPELNRDAGAKFYYSSERKKGDSLPKLVNILFIYFPFPQITLIIVDLFRDRGQSWENKDRPKNQSD